MRKLKFFYIYVNQHFHLKFFASVEAYMKLKENSKVFVATAQDYPTSIFVLNDSSPSPKMGHIVQQSRHERSGRNYIEVKGLLKEMQIEKMKSYQCYKYQDIRYKGVRIDFKTPIK